MKALTIQQVKSDLQDAKEGIFTMKGLSLTRLLHTLIREYGTYQDNSYYVDALHLTISDKKLLLSHILDSEEYEWGIESSTRIESLFLEHIKHIQDLFTWEYSTVYSEDMEEAGMIRRTYHDNGEVYWINR